MTSRSKASAPGTIPLRQSLFAGDEVRLDDAACPRPRSLDPFHLRDEVGLGLVARQEIDGQLEPACGYTTGRGCGSELGRRGGGVAVSNARQPDEHVGEGLLVVIQQGRGLAEIRRGLAPSPGVEVELAPLEIAPPVLRILLDRRRVLLDRGVAVPHGAVIVRKGRVRFRVARGELQGLQQVGLSLVVLVQLDVALASPDVALGVVGLLGDRLREVRDRLFVALVEIIRPAAREVPRRRRRQEPAVID